MFEEFRSEAGDYSFDDEPEQASEQDVYALKEIDAPSKGKFLGMTPVQRFIVAFMFLLMTCILSSFLLLVTERIAPPFLP
jgi:hypothetical protein